MIICQQDGYESFDWTALQSQLGWLANSALLMTEDPCIDAKAVNGCVFLCEASTPGYTAGSKQVCFLHT